MTETKTRIKIMRKATLALLTSTLLSTSALADTGTVVGVGVQIQDQWGACLFWSIKGSDGITRGYNILKSDAEYDVAKNLLLYSMTTGPIGFDTNGTACGNPRLGYVWIGQ